MLKLKKKTKWCGKATVFKWFWSRNFRYCWVKRWWQKLSRRGGRNWIILLPKITRKLCSEMVNIQMVHIWLQSKTLRVSKVVQWLNNRQLYKYIHQHNTGQCFLSVLLYFLSFAFSSAFSSYKKGTLVWNRFNSSWNYNTNWNNM